MEKVHSSVVKFYKVNVGSRRCVLPTHCNTQDLEKELGVKLEIVVA